MTDAKCAEAKRPHDMSPKLAAAFNAADLDAMVALYEPDAVLVDDMGARHQGTDAIRAAFETMLASAGWMTSTPRFVVVVGDVALASAGWRVDVTSGGETVAAAAGHSLEVLRRQADGTWRYLVDCPAGVVDDREGL